MCVRSSQPILKHSFYFEVEIMEIGYFTLIFGLLFSKSEIITKNNETAIANHYIFRILSKVAYGVGTEYQTVDVDCFKAGWIVGSEEVRLL